MSEFDAGHTLIRLFGSLRLNNFTLGVGELLAAFDALESGLEADSPEALKEMVELLWCKSQEERREFEHIWNSVVSATASADPGEKRSETRRPVPRTDPLPESAKE